LNENIFLSFSSLQSQSAQTSYNFDLDDERRALREELEKYRRENDSLRKSFHLNSNKNHGDERDKLITASVDSGVDTNTVGMSSISLSSNALRTELNESKERERKLGEKIHLLQKVRRKKENFTLQFDTMFSQQLESSTPQVNEVNDDNNNNKKQE
jgi:hypothetical protein